jgi:glycosyltransferase involved in cell wall biosynthesis
MRFLIVEEQLRDASSHHLQYLRTIRDAAMERNIEVTIAANVSFSKEHQSLLSAKPVLQDLSRISANRSSFSKHTTLMRNTWANASAVSQLVNNEGPFDRVLCLTSWWPQVASLLVAKWRMVGKLPPLGLLFVNYPQLGERGSAQLRLVRRLVWMLGDDVRIFAETKFAQRSWAKFLGRPVDYVVHPVAAEGRELAPVAVISPELGLCENYAADCNTTSSSRKTVVFGTYGFARHEQGIDVLMLALEILQRRGELTGDFRVLWPQGFRLPDGSWMDRQMFGDLGPNVQFLESPLSPVEYRQALAETDWLILPYRSSSYEGRCSRVSIEACVMGIPVIYTRGTDLEAVVTAHGAGIGVSEEDPAALADAIRVALLDNDRFQGEARDRRPSAKNYFSGHRFIEQLIAAAMT